MKKRLTIAALCAIAGLAVLQFLLKGPFASKDSTAASQSKGNPAARDAANGPSPSASPNQHRDKTAVPSPDPISIEFDRVTLPDVLNQLVKQAGITVTADLDDIHQQTLVSIQAFVPPLEALKMVAETYQLELLETESGWWIRPVPPTVQMLYKPSVTLEKERAQALFEDLGKLIGIDTDTPDPSNPPESITMDEEGIHVTASKAKQQNVSAYLDVIIRARGGQVISQEEAPVVRIPPVSP
jgi:hypothetical protein